MMNMQGAQPPQPPAGPPPGMQPQQPPPMAAPAQPALIPNPAYAQWQQAKQAADAVIAQNAKLTQQFQAALKVMRDDIKEGFRIDIEADSTVAADEQADKAARTEFLEQMVPLLEQVIPLVQGNPAFATLAKEVVLFGVRGFKIGRPLEETFEKAFDDLGQMPPPPPKGGKPTSGVDSPADLQLRAQQQKSDAAEAAGKIQVMQQANAIKAQQVAQQAEIDHARLDAETTEKAGRLALDHIRAQDEAQLRQARETSLGAKSARGLE